MLYAKVVEVPERVRADGTVETPLDAGALIAALREARAEGIASVAIVFMHSYAYPEHEAAAAEAARLAGFTQISASHEVSPLVKFVGPRRHGRGRCLSLATPSPLRRPRRCGACAASPRWGEVGAPSRAG